MLVLYSEKGTTLQLVTVIAEPNSIGPYLLNLVSLVSKWKHYIIYYYSQFMHRNRHPIIGRTLPGTIILSYFAPLQFKTDVEGHIIIEYI